MILQFPVDPAGSIERPRSYKGLVDAATQRDNLVEQREGPGILPMSGKRECRLPLCPEQHQQLIAGRDGPLPALDERERLVVTAAPVEHLTPGDRPPGPTERVVDARRKLLDRSEERLGNLMAPRRHEQGAELDAGE